MLLAIRRVAGWGRIALVVAAPLAIGSVHAGVVTAESLACVALLALTLLPGHRSSGWDRTYTVPWAAAALGFALLLTLLQLVPLPAALVPTGAAAPEGAWRAASLDPPATVLEALRIAGLAALVIAFGIVVRREGLGAVRRVLWAIAAAGAVTVGLGAIGLALDVHEVLGLYLPAQPGPAAVLRGTFVSPLHQATFHGMAAISGLTLSLDRRTERWRPLAVALGGVSTLGLAASLEPAAWIASGMGALVLLGATGAARHRSGARAAPCVAASVATVLLVATASLAVAGDVPEPTDRVAASGPGAGAWSRADAVHAAMDMAKDFPLLGVGRGAIAAVFPAYNGFAPDLWFDHVPSFPIQSLAEWGLIGGGIALLAFILSILAAMIRSLGAAVSAGAVGTLVAIGCASLADFGLETNGIALPAAALLGCLVGGVAESPAGRSAVNPIPGIPARRSVLFVLACVGLAGASVLATRPFGPTLREDWDALRAAEASRTLAVDTASAAAERHPGSYVFPLVTGTLLSLEDRHAEALERLERARVLNPHAGAPRVARLRALLAAGRLDEASAAWRELAAAGRPAPAEALAYLWQDASVRDLLPALVPETAPEPGPVRDLAGFLASVRRPDLAAAVFERAAVAAPAEPSFLARLGRLRLGAGDAADAERIATRLIGLHPKAPEGYDLMGMALAARGRNFEAAHMHIEAANLVPGDTEPLFAAGAALVDGGTTLGADEVLARLDRLCGSMDCRWRLAQLRSRIHAADGLVVAAIGALEEADRLVPGDADVLLRIADLHAAAGDHGGEAMALRRLLARHPGHARAAERLGGLGTPVPAPAPEQPARVGEPPAPQRLAEPGTRRSVW